MDYGRLFNDEQLAAGVAEGKCPSCDRPTLDLRGAGFNADALAADGQCFWFNAGTLQCNNAALKPWPWPWPKPRSVYDNNGPGAPVEVAVDGVRFFVDPTGDEGVDTGRRRFKTTCLTCAVVLHANSTGVANWIEGHMRQAHTKAAP